jgi:Skp family chaperone for outer membrane proteins
MNTPIRTNWLAVLLLLVVAGMIAHQSRANRPAPLTPTVVATVDLQKVFEKVNERAAADKELEALRDELAREVERQRGVIEVLRQDLDIFPAGSPEHQKASRELTEKAFALQAQMDYVEAKRNVSNARVLRRIYENVRKAVAELAGHEGWDLVILDDTVVELPLETTETEMTRQISARRLLYAAKEIDVTEDVIAHMNK